MTENPEYDFDFDGGDFDYDYEPEDPTTCPRCNSPLTVEPEDRSVGIFGNTVFCEECGLGLTGPDYKAASSWENEDGTTWDGVITIDGIPYPEPEEVYA